MIGVVPLASHPKNVGRVLYPPLTNPFVLGTRGMRIPTSCCRASWTARSYVVRNADPFGHEYSVSADESKARMASTPRYGIRSGSIGKFWFVSPASTSVKYSRSEIYRVSARSP